MKTTPYHEQIQKCVRQYWTTRKNAHAKNQKGLRKNSGTRGGVTAGKNLDGFLDLLRDEILEVGRGQVEVHERKKLVTLPGYFRPTKQWDLVVFSGEKLLAVVELKSLGGPSFGNNANNRCEEAIGSGVDFRTVQREGGFGRGVTPFLGFFLLVHEEEGSRRPAAKLSTSPHFTSDPVFNSASYLERMNILSERLMQENIYDCAATMASPPAGGKTGEYSNLSSETSFARLLVKILAHVKTEISLC